MTLAEFLTKYPRARRAELSAGLFIDFANLASFLSPERSNANSEIYRLTDYRVERGDITQGYWLEPRVFYVGCLVRFEGKPTTIIATETLHGVEHWKIRVSTTGSTYVCRVPKSEAAKHLTHAP